MLLASDEQFPSFEKIHKCINFNLLRPIQLALISIILLFVLEWICWRKWKPAIDLILSIAATRSDSIRHQLIQARRLALWYEPLITGDKWRPKSYYCSWRTDNARNRFFYTIEFESLRIINNYYLSNGTIMAKHWINVNDVLFLDIPTRLRAVNKARAKYIQGLRYNHFSVK